MKNYRFGFVCIFFFVLFVEDFCLGVLLVLLKNWLLLNCGGDYGGWGVIFVGWDW